MVAIMGGCYNGHWWCKSNRFLGVSDLQFNMCTAYYEWEKVN